MLVTKFGEITKTRILWFRLFSAYGPKDNPNHLLPHLIDSLLNGACPPLTLGEQKWDYLYVEDAVEALIAAAMSPKANGIFNLASGQVHSLRAVIESARDQIDPHIVLQFGALPYRPDQVMHLEGKIGRLEYAAGWRPQISLTDGLRRTVAWYKKARSTAQQ
jgi:nucleoside-diphosphate-sugar epimerase